MQRVLDSHGSAAPSATRTPYFGSGHGPTGRHDRHAGRRPGERTIVPVVFTLPESVMGERLMVMERSPETRLVIGHGNGFFHPRAAFRMNAIDPERTAQR